MPIERKIILCHTPFHLLMAETVLNNKDKIECEIWLVEDFPNAEAIVHALKRSGAFNSVSQIRRFPGYASCKSIFHYTLAARKVASCFRQLWKKNPFNSAIIFNDYPYTARILIDLLQYKQATIHLAEDGAEFYRSSAFAPKSSLERRLLQLLFGLDWKQIHIIGDSVPNATIHATFPNHLRPELLQHPHIPLSNHPLRSLDASAALNYLEKPQPSGKCPQPADGPLILLPHSESVPDLIQTISQINTLALEANSLVQIKPHPREHTNILNQLHKSGYELLPAEIPTELYVLAGRTKHLIGGHSTALYAAKWLNPQVEVCSWPFLQTSKDCALDAFFSAIDIKLTSLN
jgi:hypothetical protein